MENFLTAYLEVLVKLVSACVVSAGLIWLVHRGVDHIFDACSSYRNRLQNWILGIICFSGVLLIAALIITLMAS